MNIYYFDCMKKAVPEGAVANTLDDNLYDVRQGSPRIIVTVSPERSALKKRLNRGSPVLVDFVSRLF